jgi:4-amino-4-deoxy-L-arabinose transferase-like glycosyltransferase
MSPFLRSRAAWYALAAVFIVASLFVLEVRTLIPPDEGRYAEMAREMLLSGDWVTTRLNGIKYFEKPPLHTWMSAVSFALFGIGEWQARLWNGVCGIFGVLMVAYTGRRVYGGLAGEYAALVLASMLFWAGASQFNSLDMGVAATMCLSLCALLIAQHGGATETQRRWWMLVCWGGMGLSLLAKGLIGIVLPGAVLVLYSLISGDRGIWRRLHISAGVPLFLLVALPWFVLVGMRNPEQPAFFFIHEHWDRFFLREHHREGPWYYFLALLLPTAMPWIAIVPASLMAARRTLPGRFQPGAMLLVWIAFILAFFSYSSSKLPGYMLPVFPALALLMGRQLERASGKTVLALTAVPALAGIAGLCASWLAPGIDNLRPLLTAASLAALLGAAAGYFAERGGRRTAMVVALAISGWLMTQLLMAATEPHGREQSGVALAKMLRPALTPDTPVYSVGAYEQSMTFYMAHKVTTVAFTDELEFGLQREPQLGIPTLEEFIARWQARAVQGLPQYAIMRHTMYQHLQQRQLPMKVIGTSERVVVVSAPAKGL